MDEEKKEQEVIKENENATENVTEETTQNTSENVVEKTPENTVEENTTVNNKKSKLPAVIAILLVVLVALLAGAYFLTDLFKSPKQLFEKYLFEKQHFSKVLNEDSELLERMTKESYEATTKVTLGSKDLAKMIGEEFPIDITELDMILNSKSDTKSNKSENNLKINYQDKEVIEVNTVTNNNKIGLQVPDIYAKYVTLENNNLKDLFKKFDPSIDTDGIPNKILTNEDLEKALTIEKKDIEKIAKKYKKIIMKNIDSENIEVDKEATVKLDFNGKEKTLDAKKYTLTINEKEALEILIEILKELKDDKDTLKLVEENYNAIIKLYEDNGYDMEAPEFNSDDIKETLDEGIKVYEEMLKTYDDAKSKELKKAKISVYVHKGETIKTALEFETSEIAFVSYGEGDEEVIEISALENAKNTPEISVKINLYVKTKVSGKKVNSDEKAKISVNMGNTMNVTVDILSINQDIEFKDVKIVEFNSNNEININNASQNELMAAGADIIAGAEKYYNDYLLVEFKDVAEKIQELFETQNTLDTYEDVYNTTDYNTFSPLELENVTL